MKYLLLTLFFSLTYCQGLDLTLWGPIIGGCVGVAFLCHVLIFCCICFEMCRQKCCAKRRENRPRPAPQRANANPPQNQAPSRNRRNNRSRNNRNANPAPETSARYNDLNVLANDISSTETKKLEFNKELFCIDNASIKLKRRIRPVDQNEKRCNTFKVNITGRGSSFFFLKFYSIPVKFFYTNDLFKKLESEMLGLQSSQSKFSSNHVVKFIGFSVREKTRKLGYVTEYYKSNLRKYSAKVSFRRKLKLLYNLATIVEEIDGSDFVYEYLTYKNVLIDSNENIKLLDYRYDQTLKKFFSIKDKEMFWFDSPEKFANTSDLTYKHDIFSFGILMHALLTNTWEPLKRFVDSGKSFYSSKIKSDPLFRPKIADKYLNDESMGWYVSLMKLCWGMEPNERPSFSNIKKIIKKNEGKYPDNTDEIRKPKAKAYGGDGELPERNSEQLGQLQRPKIKRKGKRRTRNVSVSNLPDSDGILLPGEEKVVARPNVDGVKIPKPVNSTGEFNELDEDFLNSVNEREDALRVEENLFDTDEDRKRKEEEKKKKEEEEEKKRKKEERKKKKKEEERRRKKEEKRKKKEKEEREREEKRRKKKEEKKRKKNNDGDELVLSSDSEDEANEEEEKELIKLGILSPKEARNAKKFENVSVEREENKDDVEEKKGEEEEEDGEDEEKRVPVMIANVENVKKDEKDDLVIESDDDDEDEKKDDVESSPGVEESPSTPLRIENKIKEEIEKEENEISQIEKEIELELEGSNTSELDPKTLENKIDESDEGNDDGKLNESTELVNEIDKEIDLSFGSVDVKPTFEFNNVPPSPMSPDNESPKKEFDDDDSGMIFEDLKTGAEKTDQKTSLDDVINENNDSDDSDVGDVFNQLPSMSKNDIKEAEDDRITSNDAKEVNMDELKFEIEDDDVAENNDDDGILMEKLTDEPEPEPEMPKNNEKKEAPEPDIDTDEDGVIFEKLNDTSSPSPLEPSNKKNDEKKLISDSDDSDDDEKMEVKKSIISDSESDDDNVEKKEIEDKGVLFETLKGGLNMKEARKKYDDEVDEGMDKVMKDGDESDDGIIFE